MEKMTKEKAIELSASILKNFLELDNNDYSFGAKAVILKAAKDEDIGTLIFGLDNMIKFCNNVKYTLQEYDRRTEENN